MAGYQDADVINAAAQNNIPPAILLGLIRQQGATTALHLPAATLAAYGMSANDAQNDALLTLQIAARTLSQQFQQYGDWEQAVSAYATGDPSAARSPTSPVGGLVHAVLGSAAANADFGLAGMQPGNVNAFQRAASGFATQLDGLVSMGGIISPQVASRFKQSYAAVGSQYQTPSPQATAGGGGVPGGPTTGVPSGMDAFAGNYPSPTFTAHPFASSFMGGESENFGYQWEGTTERGNDYAMPQGTPLTAAETGEVVLIPWAGRLDVGIRVSDGPWKGWTIGYGHSHALAPNIQVGQVVKAGQPLAVSGGSPGDPLAGMSSGAHVEFQLIDPSGQWRDPQKVLVATEGTQASMARGSYGGAKAGADQARDLPKQAQQQHPDPAAVGEFAAQLQQNGIDPQHFAEHFGFFADQRRRLLQTQRTDVSDYVAVRMLDRGGMMAHILSQPHTHYPSLTVQQMVESRGLAELYSVQHLGRMPTDAETARFAQAKLGQPQVADYYQRISDKQTRDAAMPSVTPQKLTSGAGPQPQPGQPNDKGAAGQRQVDRGA